MAVDCLEELVQEIFILWCLENKLLPSLSDILDQGVFFQTGGEGMESNLNGNIFLILWPFDDAWGDSKFNKIFDLLLGRLHFNLFWWQINNDKINRNYTVNK